MEHTVWKKDVYEYFLLFEKEDKIGMSFKKYVKETNYEINPYEESKQDYEEGECCWCGSPFGDAFFENPDDETVDVAPRKTTKIMNAKTFTQRYCVGNTLAEIEKIHDEYKETHITPALQMTKPPKRYPLYKKANRKKVFDHDHLKEKDNGSWASSRLL